MKRVRWSLVAVTAMLLVGEVLLSQSALAVSNQGPDPGDYGAGNEVHMEGSRIGAGNALDAPRSFVTLYFTQPSGNRVTISHFDQCRYSDGVGRPSNPIDSPNGPANWYPVNVPGQGNMTYVFTTGGRNLAQARNTVWDRQAGNCENSARTFNLNDLSRSQRPGLEGFYEAQLTANMSTAPSNDGTVQAFKVRVDPGIGCDYTSQPERCNYVSWSPLSGNRFALQQRGLGGAVEFHEFDLRFAASCDITSRRAVSLEWFDDDQQAGNQGRPIYFQIERKPKGAPISEFEVLGPGDVVGARGDGRYYPQGAGEDRERRTTIYVEPNYDYAWEWHDVQTQNGIQFQIPFESIYYQIPCNNFNLLPRVTEGQTIAYEGQPVTFGYQVENEGPNPARPIEWMLRRRTIPASTPPLPQQNTNRTAQAQFGASGDDVTYQPGRISSPQGAVGGTHRETFPVTAEAGQKVCTSIGVDPAGQGVAWRYSAERCVLVVRRPTVHFMGGDLSVGNPYASSAASTCATRAGTGGVYTIASRSINGSVAEYGAFLRGLIDFQPAAGEGFGTASRPGMSANFMRQLGFANTDGSQVGEFGNGDCMSDYYSKYRSEIGVSANPGATTLTGSRRVNYDGNVTLNASAVQNGARIIMVVDGDVTINGNIRYSDNYPDRAAVPSIAVIASGDIRVADAVTQLDGIYISKGRFHTCANGPSQLTTNVCNQQLNLRGVLMTDRLQLRRTYGAEAPNVSQPGERFDYTTELFFNNVLNDAPDNRIDTIEQRDLPPRY